MGIFSDLIPGGGGKAGKMSAQESPELSRARENNEQGRDIFPALAETYRVAQRYPGGIPQNVIDKVRKGVGSDDPVAQDYQLFDTLAGRAALAKLKLFAPVSNAEFPIAKSIGANPVLKFDNNKQIIGQDFSNASRAYFQNAFKQRWAAKNGGLNGRDKQGHSYAEDLSRVMRQPGIQNLMQAPWKRKGAAKAKVIDFNELDD